MTEQAGASRPVTIDDVCARLANFRSAEAVAAQESHQARADDVYISTYSKSGTTWVQQIVHQLRSGGDTDFEEISCVVPWLESAVDIGIDPDADQPYSFRAYKCHMLYRDLPEGARYITVLRDPVSVLSSFYRFFEGWWFEPGSISIDDFAARLYIPGSASGRHWDHLIDWWGRIDSGDTLVLCYEDMVLAADKTVELVADFLQLKLSDAALATAKLHSSREFMTRHADQFDEHVLRRHRDPVWGLPAGGSSGKVLNEGAACQISEATLQALDTAWGQTVESALGFKSYQDLRSALPNLLAVDRSKS